MYIRFMSFFYFLFIFFLASLEGIDLGNPMGGYRILSSNMDVNGCRKMQLDDCSIWNVQALKNSSQSWSEWWSDQEPEKADPRFVCEPKFWKNMSRILVYRPKIPIVQGFPFVLENVEKSELLCAQLNGPDQFFFPKEDFVRQLLFFATVKEEVIQRSMCVDESNVLVLQGEKLWELQNFEKNNRSWGDWWKGIHPEQPDKSFLFSIKDWKNGDVIESYDIDIYKAFDSLPFYDYSSRNEERFLKILFHPIRREFAYAKQIKILELIVKLERVMNHVYHEGFEDGYSYGYSLGRMDAYNEKRQANREEIFREE